MVDLFQILPDLVPCVLVSVLGFGGERIVFGGQYLLLWLGFGWLVGFFVFVCWWVFLFCF